MASPEILEWRLRMISFVFVAVGILLSIGNSIIASALTKEALATTQLDQLSQQALTTKILSQLSYESFANKCIATGILFVQLGILFFIYVLFSKIKRLENTI